ncbi:rickettsial conserved hypothetical protein [Rickettsia typhi str. Wilmington]|uniref:Uncharacterized protein n=2 Tax=Rickettsia typhi TaxID=785 RepID=Q68X48_RICTY|nr:rickettsial conserved hypothetical protein [Rickettsia typhi str. Wilmington]AFE54171.1 hypothetical protein RTTH1527_01530 [Rickettsia typhi str. TH1527]AFE55011.1 hypothetical protein RTB9991CWPP_01540 [Rickettsia typhi str. B9991CWPP]
MYKEFKAFCIAFLDNEELEIYNSVNTYKGIFIIHNHSQSDTLSKFSQELKVVL